MVASHRDMSIIICESLIGLSLIIVQNCGGKSEQHGRKS